MCETETPGFSSTLRCNISCIRLITAWTCFAVGKIHSPVLHSRTGQYAVMLLAGIINISSEAQGGILRVLVIVYKYCNMIVARYAKVCRLSCNYIHTNSQ